MFILRMNTKKVLQEPKGVKINHLPNAVLQNDSNLWTALHDAAAAGDENKCQLLLARNCDRIVKSTDGNTPLHEAAWRGYSRCVKILCTPVASSGAKEKPQQILKLSNTRFLKHFLDVQNSSGFTALHLAAQNGHNQSCRELLLAGANPDIKNNYGDTPLHTSCRYGHAGATRILISADCDPNIVNLNGDHPLHITCAMGRRKLTRLLLEADCEMNIRNAQNETPRDIAVRKNFSEIIDILKNPQRIRNRRDKPKDSGRKSSLPHPTDLNSISWSPYGCHYFPDPRSFPSPKLETLPKEPLKKGEQYYLDLAGHIRKGPIGIGSTCYCGPFFKHIEHKINSNRKSLRKYVYRTKECLDNKVQALAQQTNDQIEQLTRSVIADRERCENRRLLLNKILQRGEPIRSTTDCQMRTKTGRVGTLERSRSMEIIEKNSNCNRTLSNAKSCGGLLNEVSIIVHRSNDLSSSAEEEECTEMPIDPSVSANSINHFEHVSVLNDQNETLCDETTYLNEVHEDSNIIKECVEENASSETSWNKCGAAQNTNESHIKNSVLMFPYSTSQISGRNCINEYDSDKQKSRFENITKILDESGLCETRANQFDIKASKTIETNWGKQETINHSLRNDVSNCSPGSRASLFTNINENECTFESMISALRLKESLPLGSQVFNETHFITDDKLSYKSKNASLKINSSALCSKPYAENIPKKDTIPYTEVTKVSRYSPALSEDERVNGTIEKVEVKNSEIKMLKKPSESESISKRSKVQELVARLQGKLISAQFLSQSKKRNVKDRKASQSESSEDEQNTHNEYKSSAQNFCSKKNVEYNKESEFFTRTPLENFCTKISNDQYFDSNLQNMLESCTVHLPKRIVPKDAYFHELPSKKRDDNYRFSQKKFPLSQNTQLHADCTHDDQEFDISSELNSAFQNSRIINHDINRNVSNSVTIIGTESPTIASNFQYANDVVRTSCNYGSSSVQLPVSFSHLSNVPFFERDMSNDSGVSTHFYNGPIDPSPSLSPQINYPSKDHLQPQEVGNFHSCQHANKSSYDDRIQDRTLELEYSVGNISSLV